MVRVRLDPMTKARNDSNRDLSGLFPPLPTPFDAEGEFAPGLQRDLIGQLEPSVDGFVVLGSNGEAALLGEDERREVLAAARAATSKVLIAGTGGEATRLVLERTLAAAELGADYALVLPPHYFRSAMTDAALRLHYESLAERSSIPLLLYNIPQVTGLALSPELIAALAQHPNIVGLKDSSGNVLALGETLRQAPADFSVLTGNAPTLLPALSLGARGGILAVVNVAAEAYRALLEHASRGELAEAREVQLSLNPLALAVTRAYGVAGLKAALHLQGRSVGAPRPPLTPLGPEGQEVLRRFLEAL